MPNSTTPGSLADFGLVHSEEKAVPLVGGTLLILSDQNHAVASDPDRDVVYVVDLATQQLEHVVSLEPGDEPGQVLELPDAAGPRVVVALRRGNAIVTLDVHSGELISRRDACAAPRGLGYDAERKAVLLACRSGEVVRWVDGKENARWQLPTGDLRSIVADGERYLVSEFRRARVFELDPESGIQGDAVVAPLFSPVLGRAGYEARVAYQMLKLADARVVVQHQRHATSALVQEYYPTQAGPACTGVVHGAVSVLAPRTVPGETGGPEENPAGTEQTGVSAGVSAPEELAENAPEPSQELAPLANLPPGYLSDVAISRDGARYAALSPRGSLGATLTLAAGTPPRPKFEVRFGDLTAEAADCTSSKWSTWHGEGQAQAVALMPDDTVVVQLREPAELQIFADAGLVTIPLAQSSRADTGHLIFHSNTAANVACASCHPEGGDDSHTWNFASPVNKRRTQSLWGGLLSTVPLHWEGEHSTVRALMTDTFVRRMLGAVPQPAQADLLGTWLDSVPRPPTRGTADPTAIQLGRAAFEKAACQNCHVGEQLTDNLNHDVGTGRSIQTPSLLGLRHRAPFMMSGCAATVAERFDLGAAANCGGSKHGEWQSLKPAELDALIVYLEAL